MKIDPKLRGFGALAVAALMLGTAPAALFAETPADTLVIADAIDDIVSLDPHEAYEFSGLDVINNTYDGLVELDPATSAMVPGLSDSWTASDDGLTGNADIRIQADVGGQIFYLSFNQKDERFKNQKFLEAMRWAVDYKGVTDTFLKGSMVVHQAFLPTGIPPSA